MEDGAIEDFQISASSSYHGYPAVNARLNQGIAWCADPFDHNPFLQVGINLYRYKNYSSADCIILDFELTPKDAWDAMLQFFIEFSSKLFINSI